MRNVKSIQYSHNGFSDLSLKSITAESFTWSLFNKSLLYDPINPLTVFYLFAVIKL